MAAPPRARIPSARENLLAWGAVAVLALVLTGVLVQQARFNPAVLVAIAGPPAKASTTTAAIPDLLAAWPDGLKPMSAAEAFTPETLSDKIDGKAELYFSAGFVALRCQRAVLAADPQTWMESFVFDMGSPANAYSVFSSQRRPEAATVELGDYAYQAGNALCLVHGRYYLELVATDVKDATLVATRALARAFLAAIPVESHADMSREQSLFPREGLIPGSVTLLSADVFGFDRLKDVFVARYRDGRDTVTLFLTRRPSPAEAAELAAAFRVFLVRDCGGHELPPPAAPAGAVLVDLGGVFDGFVNAGNLLAGVHQAPSRAAVERWLQRLHAGLPGPQP